MGDDDRDAEPEPGQEPAAESAGEPAADGVPESVSDAVTEPVELPPITIGSKTVVVREPSTELPIEPSLELDIAFEEELRSPITSSDGPAASGTYEIAKVGARGRRKHHAAGVHQSLAGLEVREDTGAHAVVDEPEPPPSHTRRRAPRKTSTYASVGAAPREPTSSIDALGHARPRPATGMWDTSKTGFYKPLPATGRIVRLWEELGLRVGQRIAEAVGDDHLYLLMMAVLVGVASGATAGVLLLWIARAVELFPAVGKAFPSFGWIYLVLAPALGGLMVGALRVVARRYFGDLAEGIPAVIEAVGQQGQLKGRSGGVLGIGTGLTIASGGSVGHEGPTVAIGATVGSVVARFFGLRMRRQTTMVGAGCAAGLASAFNAPLAGVIFTVEVVFKRSVGGNVGTMSVFTPLIVAAVAGTFTSYAIFGERSELIAPGDVAGDRLLLEMIFFLALAVVAGLLSPLMSRVILWIGDLFERMKSLPQWIRPGLGGLGVGILGVVLFAQLLGPGRGIVFDALNSELVWQIALQLALLKILATALTIGSGGMGGVFMPSLVIGACVGTVVHALAALVLGDGVSQPAAYALVGMGAYLGATLRAPLTPIVMIFELTGDYGLILPLMFACILSAFVAGRVEKDTLFDLTLRRRGSSRVLDTGDDIGVMQRGHVGDLMVLPDHMLRMSSSFEELQRAALVEDTPTLYLLDEHERVAGVIDSRALAARVLRGEVDHEASAGSMATNERPTLLVPDDTLAGAMLAFSRSGRDVLPVVDADRQLLGLLERTVLMTHYSEHVLEQRDAELALHSGAGLDHEVNLGLGVTLERVVVGRNWAGRSLIELDLRGQVNVQVLEWRRDDQLLTIDPKQPLREGDVLALAGNRDDLLAARWVN
ncbi:chloride channel protein [Enhygromyxa salina]|uniref:H(+)/Cl(-) exchange transporter ClcA n=1 Tax=Enhygromyxa salina TaxID=215803 RepID=A0A2S9YV16_9BACT|nr:chloride channel protein [Enhygromyxa salina]PRQ08882.1 H(+)/Cl(-) exchange transporter ClcA [Enhygromyxa salina]